MVPIGELYGAVDALVADIVARPPQALHRGKVLLNTAPDLSRSEHDHRHRHRQSFVDLACTPAHRTAVQSFLARRKEQRPHP